MNINIITISSLYPNNKDPKHGIFVETRLRHLIKDFPEVKPTVIAPVPWFPFSSKRFGEYAKHAGVVEQETRNGIEVHHPKYLVIPKVGMYLTPLFMSWAISRTLKKLSAISEEQDPRSDTSRMTEGETSRMTEGETSRMTEGETSRMTEGEISRMTEDETSKMTEGEISRMTEDETSKMTEGDSRHSSSPNTRHSSSDLGWNPKSLLSSFQQFLGRNPKSLFTSFQQFLGWNPKPLPFDLIDGHYFYPDGVAIAKVSEKFNIPFTCTARGTDINLIPQYPKALKMIKEVFQQASHMMTVCQALKDEMRTLGADKNKITTLRNGVDLDLFSPSNEGEQQALKDELGITNKLVMSVGWLIERKGHYLVIDAIQNINNTTLAIAGNGPDLSQLKTQVKVQGLENRVKFLGALSQPELNKWFKAADVTVLASSREGWANVLLESMASGTPVVATKVWGTPEVVTTEHAGILVERTVESIGQGIETLMANAPQRAATRRYAEEFDWQSTSQGQYEIFKRIHIE